MILVCNLLVQQVMLTTCGLLMLNVVIVLLLRCPPYSEIHVGEQEEFSPFSLDDPSCSVAAS